MIIDFHAHIYPEKISSKATLAISEFYDGAPMAFSGTASELIESGRKCGVTKYVVHSAATGEKQVSSINNFILSEMNEHSEFIGFGTMHPDFLDFENELKKIKNEGMKGIKLHPDFQKFKADCEQMDNIYEVCSSLGLIVLFHAGDARYDFSGPKRIFRVLEKHPKLKIVAAHFGGYTEWDKSLEILCGKNIFFDTSSTLWKLPYEKADQMIAAHGIEKFLFGSDFPMWSHEEELKRFNRLKLSENDKELILYENAKNLLGL